MAGVDLHGGNTKVYNASGVAPPNVGRLGDGAWSPAGVLVLGIPIGGDGFVSECLSKRAVGEQNLLDEVVQLPDL
eukprot:6786344-Karenia_brevis.AAC.1